jgi:multisubunit Na+/H+ antiporter MnhF subunit
LGVVAGASLAAVAAGELGRVWRRGSAPLPSEAPNLLLAAEEAVAETAQVARVGYREGSTRENAMFNLLTSFVGTFVTARVVTHGLRDRARVGPFRSVRVGRRHIHHFVPGIVIAFASGTGAIVTRDEGIEPILAVPFGIGMGLTLDESALLLELDDVYWSREGILSVQITLAVTALLASIALGLRFLRRGEQAVLDPGAA